MDCKSKIFLTPAMAFECSIISFQVHHCPPIEVAKFHLILLLSIVGMCPFSDVSYSSVLLSRFL